MTLRDQVKIPFLPPLPPDIEDNDMKVYTLVLDLDETLIHFEEGNLDEDDEEGFYMIRPGAMKFLREMAKYYEVVVFTAAMPDVSHPAIF